MAGGSSVPLTIALAAGGLAVVNPCGFPLLPAFLSFYLAADEDGMPRARSRAAQGIIVGGLVATGFLGLFVVVGVPVVFGVGAIARAVPWVGLLTGAALVLVGVAGLLGRHVKVSVPQRLRPRSDRGVTAMVGFGVAYGAASLGCTLPLFLTLVATSLGGAKVSAFVAYGVGMAMVLMALSIALALLREGVTRSMRGALRYTSMIGNVLLIAAGAYLTYYWGRLKFGDTATVADDPIVGLGIQFSSRIRLVAQSHGTAFIVAAAIIVVIAAASSLRAWRRAATNRIAAP